MKLLTLNLQGFTDWQRRQPDIIAYIRETDPDIIFFQEVVYLPDTSPMNQAQLLNITLKYPFEHSAITRLQPSPHYSVYREGLAILSKYPITASNTIVLQQQEGDEHNRIIQMIDCLVDGKPVLLANVHFSITDTTDFATAHLKETIEIIDQLGEPRIIAGDFNTDHLSNLSDIWGTDYSASLDSNYISFPVMNKRIDYLLLPKKYRFGSISVSGDTLSDHTALCFEIDSATH